MAREISHGEIYWSRLSYIRPVLTHGSGPVPVQYQYITSLETGTRGSGVCVCGRAAPLQLILLCVQMDSHGC